MSCSTCVHHQFREMISKPYGYVGDIPCLRCSRFNSNDEYVPMNGQQNNFTQINTNGTNDVRR
jgi:hypothetical protein